MASQNMCANHTLLCVGQGWDSPKSTIQILYTIWLESFSKSKVGESYPDNPSD